VVVVRTRYKSTILLQSSEETSSIDGGSDFLSL